MIIDNITNKFFVSKNKKVTKSNKTEMNPNSSSIIINDLFSREYIFVLSHFNMKKNKEFYKEKIKTDNGRTFVLGLVYLDEKNAKEYGAEVKNINKDVVVEKIKIEQLMNYVKNLKSFGAEGFIINYPYNWVIYQFK